MNSIIIIISFTHAAAPGISYLVGLLVLFSQQWTQQLKVIPLNSPWKIPLYDKTQYPSSTKVPLGLHYHKVHGGNTVHSL